MVGQAVPDMSYQIVRHSLTYLACIHVGWDESQHEKL